MVTGCLRPIPTDNLFVLAGIKPADLRQKQAMIAIVCRDKEPTIFA